MDRRLRRASGALVGVCILVLAGCTNPEPTTGTSAPAPVATASAASITTPSTTLPVAIALAVSTTSTVAPPAEQKPSTTSAPPAEQKPVAAAPTPQAELPPRKPRCADALGAAVADRAAWLDAGLEVGADAGRAGDAYAADDWAGELEGVAALEIGYGAWARAWEAYVASASVLRRECSDDPLFSAIEEVLRDDILRHNEQAAACLELEAAYDDRTVFVCNYRARCGGARTCLVGQPRHQASWAVARCPQQKTRAARFKRRSASHASRAPMKFLHP